MRAFVRRGLAVSPDSVHRRPTHSGIPRRVFAMDDTGKLQARRALAKPPDVVAYVLDDWENSKHVNYIFDRLASSENRKQRTLSYRNIAELLVGLGMPKDLFVAVAARGGDDGGSHHTLDESEYDMPAARDDLSDQLEPTQVRDYNEARPEGFDDKVLPGPERRESLVREPTQARDYNEARPKVSDDQVVLGYERRESPVREFREYGGDRTWKGGYTLKDPKRDSRKGNSRKEREDADTGVDPSQTALTECGRQRKRGKFARRNPLTRAREEAGLGEYNKFTEHLMDKRQYFESLGVAKARRNRIKLQQK